MAHREVTTLEVLVSSETLRRFAIGERGFGCGSPTIPVSDCEPGHPVSRPRVVLGRELTFTSGRNGW